MSRTRQYYNFSGHAIGAAATFYRLDGQDVKHSTPAVGAAVLPPSGGTEATKVADYCYSVDQPRPRVLLSVRSINTSIRGEEVGGRIETEAQTEIESIDILEKFHLDGLKIHMLSTRPAGAAEPVVTTTGNRVAGIRLGQVEARITLDDEPLYSSGSMEQLAAFYRRQTPEYRAKYSWRFRTDPASPDIQPYGGHYFFSLVSGVELVGPETYKADMSVKGYAIHWAGFGKIIFGEVGVKRNDRQVTMARLVMGCDGEGDGTIGDGKTNGTGG